jgi:serine/threonine-protein kinase RsbW
MSADRPGRVVELDVPAEPQVVHDLRERFEEFVRPYNLSDEERQGIKVALSEACSNAVCHGSPRGNWNRVHVRYAVEDQRLILEIGDEGRGFRPHNIALPEFEEWKPSGRGLFLMQALMDEVHFERTHAGTRVRLIKNLGVEDPDAEGLCEEPSGAHPRS